MAGSGHGYENSGGAVFDCADAQAVAAELALGIASAQERGRVLPHLETCASCRRMVRELAEIADDLVLLAPAAEPPAGFEITVLNAVGQPVSAATAAVPPRRQRTRKRVLEAAVATAILLGAATAAVRSYRTGRRSRADRLRGVAPVASRQPRETAENRHTDTGRASAMSMADWCVCHQ
jgi:hypothetical protein